MCADPIGASRNSGNPLSGIRCQYTASRAVSSEAATLPCNDRDAVARHAVAPPKAANQRFVTKMVIYVIFFANFVPQIPEK